MWADVKFARAASRLQVATLRRTPADLPALVTVPLQILGLLAVVRLADRPDLGTNAVLAPALMALWQNCLIVCGEVVTQDRAAQRLELLVGAPRSFFAYLTGRAGAVTAFSGLVFVEALLFGAVFLGVVPSGRALGPALAALAVTAVAAVTTSVLLSVVFVATRNPHTYQNALSYPFFILGAVLVPTSSYPEWLQPLCRLVFLSWSSDLLRDTLGEGTADGWLGRCAVVLGLGIAAGVLAVVLLRRALDRAREEGRLAFV